MNWKTIVLCLFWMATFTFLDVAGIASLTTIHPAAALPQPPLLKEAERELALMKSSVYQHRTDVDESVGRFNFDCSGLLDYALQKIAPQAYAEVPVSISKRPLAQDFYELFSHSPPKSSHWVQVSNMSRVRAGDVVVWLRASNSDSHNTGHIMIVRAKPTVSHQSDERLISVIDSTSSPHAQDSRSKTQTGLGTGVIGVIVNSQDQPIKFRWKGGESKLQQKTDITVGRLRESAKID